MSWPDDLGRGAVPGLAGGRSVGLRPRDVDGPPPHGLRHGSHGEAVPVGVVDVILGDLAVTLSGDLEKQEGRSFIVTTMLFSRYLARAGAVVEVVVAGLLELGGQSRPPVALLLLEVEVVEAHGVLVPSPAGALADAFPRGRKAIEEPGLVLEQVVVLLGHGELPLLLLLLGEHELAVAERLAVVAHGAELLVLPAAGEVAAGLGDGVLVLLAGGDAEAAVAGTEKAERSDCVL